MYYGRLVRRPGLNMVGEIMRRYHKLTVWVGISSTFLECTVSGREDLVRVFNVHTRQARKVSRKEFASILRDARRDPLTTIERYPDRGW